MIIPTSKAKPAIIVAGLLFMPLLSAPPIRAQTPSISVGTWDTHLKTSALDGSKSYSAQLHSSTTITGSAGVVSSASLVVRCSAGKLGVFVSWPVFMGLGRTNVSYRIDTDPVQTANWDLSDNGLATGLFNEPGPARNLLDRLKSAKTLVVQASPYQRTATEAQFDLDHISEVVAATYEACP